MQVFVPVLSTARLFYRYGIASGRVFVLELLGCRPSRCVRVQAKRDPLDVRVVLQVRFECSIIEAAQRYCIDQLAVEREVAHKVDGGLKHPHLIRRGIVRDGKADILIAACHISAKAFAEKEAERLRRKRESNRKYMKKIREKSKEFAEHERIAEEKSSDSNVCVEQNATSKSNRQKVKGEKIA